MESSRHRVVKRLPYGKPYGMHRAFVWGSGRDAGTSEEGSAAAVTLRKGRGRPRGGTETRSARPACENAVPWRGHAVLGGRVAGTAVGRGPASREGGCTTNRSNPPPTNYPPKNTRPEGHLSASHPRSRGTGAPPAPGLGCTWERSGVRGAGTPARRIPLILRTAVPCIPVTPPVPGRTCAGAGIGMRAAPLPPKRDEDEEEENESGGGGGGGEENRRDPGNVVSSHMRRGQGDYSPHSAAGGRKRRRQSKRKRRRRRRGVLPARVSPSRVPTVP